MSSKKPDHPIVIFTNAFPATVIAPMVLQIGLINIGLILGGVFLGIFLDRQLGSKPAFTVGLGVLGAIIAGVLTFLLAMRAVKQARKAYLSYAEKKVEEKSVIDTAGHPEAVQKASMV